MTRPPADKILRVPRRWGFSIIAFDGDAIRYKTDWPCGASGIIFRKHLWKKDGVCRRCGEAVKKESQK